MDQLFRILKPRPGQNSRRICIQALGAHYKGHSGMRHCQGDHTGFPKPPPANQVLSRATPSQRGLPWSGEVGTGRGGRGQLLSRQRSTTLASYKAGCRPELPTSRSRFPAQNTCHNRNPSPCPDFQPTSH